MRGLLDESRHLRRALGSVRQIIDDIRKPVDALVQKSRLAASSPPVKASQRTGLPLEKAFQPGSFVVSVKKFHSVNPLPQTLYMQTLYTIFIILAMHRGIEFQPLLNRSAILNDSTAMPKVIFEYPVRLSKKTIGTSSMESPAFHARWFISSWNE